jgi:hypothetical protein
MAAKINSIGRGEPLAAVMAAKARPDSAKYNMSDIGTGTR